MPQTADCIQAFLLAEGAVFSAADGVVSGRLKICGEIRSASFTYLKNPIQTVVAVEKVTYEQMDHLTDYLMNVDPSGMLARRLHWSDGHVYWTYALLTLGSDLPEYLALWHALAECEIEQIENAISDVLCSELEGILDGELEIDIELEDEDEVEQTGLFFGSGTNVSGTRH